jgi:hypothetical protein
MPGTLSSGAELRAGGGGRREHLAERVVLSSLGRGRGQIEVPPCVVQVFAAYPVGLKVAFPARTRVFTGRERFAATSQEVLLAACSRG